MEKSLKTENMFINRKGVHASIVQSAVEIWKYAPIIV